MLFGWVGERSVGKRCFVLMAARLDYAGSCTLYSFSFSYYEAYLSREISFYLFIYFLSFVF